MPPVLLFVKLVIYIKKLSENINFTIDTYRSVS